MEFSLSAAAKATGKGKSTIHNAIKSGKLSAQRTEGGSYKIDASELARVFTLNPSEGSRMDDQEPRVELLRTQDVEVAELRVKVAMQADQLARERETVEDLRKRLDEEQTERRALQRQITSQVSQVQVNRSQSAGQPTAMRGFLQRLLGWT